MDGRIALAVTVLALIGRVCNRLPERVAVRRAASGRVLNGAMQEDDLHAALGFALVRLLPSAVLIAAAVKKDDVRLPAPVAALRPGSLKTGFRSGASRSRPVDRRLMHSSRAPRPSPFSRGGSGRPGSSAATAHPRNAANREEFSGRPTHRPLAPTPCRLHHAAIQFTSGISGVLLRLAVMLDPGDPP
jgi:hypothetical protein